MLGKQQPDSDVPSHVPLSVPGDGHPEPAGDGYFPLPDWQLEAFEGQSHPEQVGPFRVVNEPTGAFDAKVYPSTDCGFDYVMGWLHGKRAMQETGMQRT